MTTITRCDFPKCGKELTYAETWTLSAPWVDLKDNAKHDEYDLCLDHAKVIKFVIQNGGV